MHKICVTVMHTGTRSIRHIYEQKGFVPVKMAFPNKAVKKHKLDFDKRYFYGHPFPDHLDTMDALLELGGSLITTVRHPDAVVQSWSRRYNHDYKLHNTSLPEQYRLWLDRVVPRADAIFRAESLPVRHNPYEGIHQHGPEPVLDMREEIMEVWQCSTH